MRKNTLQRQDLSMEWDLSGAGLAGPDVGYRPETGRTDAVPVYVFQRLARPDEVEWREKVRLSA